MKTKELPTLYKRTSSGKDQVWRIWTEMTFNFHGVICTEFGLIDGKKQLLTEVIREGKNIGKKNETTPIQQAQAEAKARWEKQLSRKGYALTSSESASIRGLSPMLAQVYEKQAKNVHWDSAYAQPKLDGFRALARRIGKSIKITSRENQPMLALEHIVDELSHNKMLKEGIILDGEMYCHGMPLNQISSACKRKSKLTDKIQYHVYDMLSKDDFGARHTDLYSILGSSRDNIIQVKTVKVRNEQDLFVCQKEFLEEGYEGAMLRHGKDGYEAGKRSSHLLKVKTFLDDDFEIVDWKLGRGQYAGVPIFTCKTPHKYGGYDFDVVAPGTMEEKRALASRVANLIGKKLNVKFQYYTKTEEPVPFLPVAMRFKED